MRRSSTYLILASLVLLVSACELPFFSGGSTVMPEPVDRGFELNVPTYGDEELESIARDIQKIVGRQADDAGSCRAVGIGAKPCGGPWTSIVYSVDVTDEEALLDLVTRFNARQDLLNRELGMASDCAYVGTPKYFVIERGLCVPARAQDL